MYYSDFINMNFSFPKCDEMGFAKTIENMRKASSENINSLKIKVYPNPTRSNLKIDGIDSGFYVILNYLGQTVLSGPFTRGILTESLKPGYYSLIISNGVTSKIFKFSKE
jgi:hypothetical protein